MEYSFELKDSVLYESKNGLNTAKTSVSGANKSKYNQKYSVVFQNFMMYKGGSEWFPSSEMVSGAVFETEAEALAGGDRALQSIVDTGRYPNMCEKF